MTLKQFLLLLIPSALWGSSFIFMKELAPIFGPVLTAALRIVSAAVFLIILFAVTKYPIMWKKYWKKYLIIGIGNSAIPFSLYAYAALYIPASLSVILNSTSPMFGAIFGYILLKDRLTWNKFVGLLLGSLGVGIVSSLVLANSSLELYLSILGCLGAALMYGLSGAYVKKYALEIEAKQLTVGTLTFAGVGLLILWVLLIPFGINPTVVIDALGWNIALIIVFGIMCTSIPYIIYYRLLQEIGPLKALTVTYLMPVFGVIWSLFYGETIELNTIVGLFVILVGIYVLSLQKKEGAI